MPVALCAYTGHPSTPLPLSVSCGSSKFPLPLTVNCGSGFLLPLAVSRGSCHVNVREAVVGGTGVWH